MWKGKQYFPVKEITKNKMERGTVWIEAKFQNSYYYQRLKLVIWSSPSIIRDKVNRAIAQYLKKNLNMKGVQISNGESDVTLTYAMSSGRKKDNTYKKPITADKDQLYINVVKLLKGKLSSILAKSHLEYDIDDQWQYNWI